MFVKQQQYKDKRTGRTKKSRKHTIFFNDHKGVERSIPGFRDKAASEELGRQVERLVALRAANMPPHRSMTEWLQALSFKVQLKFVACDILDAERAAAAKPLLAHVGDFKSYLTSKGDTAVYCVRKATRILKVFKDCGFQYFHHIRSEAVQQCIADFRDHRGEPLAPRTMNFYTQAVRQFCSWMVRKKRATESPVRDLEMRNFEVDIRHERRALTKKEFESLLTAAYDGPKRFGMSGPDRALLYLLAAETGLRAREIGSLTGSSFDFGAEPPTVTIEARYSKRRHRDVQPLRPELAEMMRAHLADSLPKAPAFNMPHDNERVPMLREDEEVAGIEYKDSDGKFADFHSLRHTFITNLAKSGVHPKVAQRLARHSTIRLTMDHYTHVEMEQQTEALAKLPTFRPSPSRKGAKKTGTTDMADEGSDEGSDLPPDLPELSGKQGKPEDSRRLLASCSKSRVQGVTASSDKGLAPSKADEDWRRRADSNRRMRVLQTLALPLGYVASSGASGHGSLRDVPGRSSGAAVRQAYDGGAIGAVPGKGKPCPVRKGRAMYGNRLTAPTPRRRLQPAGEMPARPPSLL